MKKQKLLLKMAMGLSAVSLMYSAPALADNNYRGKITANDFKNAQDFQRNLKGECDATCGVDVPTPVPGTDSETPLVLDKAVLQTETRPQTCQDIGYPADWLGSVTQQRHYYTQNGVRLAGTETPWVTTVDTCRAPYPCTARAVSWTAGGQTCSGNLPATASSTTAGVNNTAAKRAGSAVYSCFDGTYTYSSGNCVYVPSNCSGFVRWGSWNACGYNASALHGGTTWGNTTEADTTGSATFSCNDGVFSYAGGGCTITTPPAGGCSGGTVVVDGNTRAAFPGERGRRDNVGGQDWGANRTAGSYSFGIGANTPNMSDATSPEFRVGYTVVGGVNQYRYHRLVYKCIRTCQGSLVEIPNSGRAIAYCPINDDAWHWVPRGYSVRVGP